MSSVTTSFLSAHAEETINVTLNSKKTSRYIVLFIFRFVAKFQTIIGIILEKETTLFRESNFKLVHIVMKAIFYIQIV